jgi:hypothetical protein
VCCGVLLAHLQAAGWSGAEGASDGCGEGSGVVLLCSSVSHGPGSGLGKLGIDKGVPMAWLQGLGRTRTASAQ